MLLQWPLPRGCPQLCCILTMLTPSHGTQSSVKTMHFSDLWPHCYLYLKSSSLHYRSGCSLTSHRLKYHLLREAFFDHPCHSPFPCPSLGFGVVFSVCFLGVLFGFFFFFWHLIYSGEGHCGVLFFFYFLTQGRVQVFFRFVPCLEWSPTQSKNNEFLLSE